MLGLTLFSRVCDMTCWRTTGVFLLIAAVPTGHGSAQAEQPRLSDQELQQRAAESAAEPGKLLDLPDQVSAGDVRRVLRALIKRRRDEEGPLPEVLLGAFAKTFARVSRTVPDIVEVVGAEAPKTVIRQVFYRRYREEWIFGHPLSCCVVFDCEKGKDLRVLTVLPIAEGSP